MSERQRQSLVELMHSILACKCCPPDIRFRAENLLSKLHGKSNGRHWLDDVFRAARGASC
jgi:hypothetical protein